MVIRFWMQVWWFPCSARSTSTFLTRVEIKLYFFMKVVFIFDWFYDLTHGTINMTLLMMAWSTKSCLNVQWQLVENWTRFGFYTEIPTWILSLCCIRVCFFLQICELVGLTIIHKKTKGRERERKYNFFCNLYIVYIWGFQTLFSPKWWFGSFFSPPKPKKPMEFQPLVAKWQKFGTKKKLHNWILLLVW